MSAVAPKKPYTYIPPAHLRQKVKDCETFAAMSPAERMTFLPKTKERIEEAAGYIKRTYEQITKFPVSVDIDGMTVDIRCSVDERDMVLRLFANTKLQEIQDFAELDSLTREIIGYRIVGVMY